MINKGDLLMDKSLTFMQIAMKYVPEAKQKLDELGINLSQEHIEPLFSLLTKVMDDAYQEGYKDASEKANA